MSPGSASSSPALSPTLGLTDPGDVPAASASGHEDPRQPARSPPSALCIANPPLVPHLPVHAAAPTLLLLGSMTAVAGLARQQYYAHAQNHFWHIMGGVLGQADFAASAYEQRLDRMLRAGVCLWNVLAKCERKGSLDSAIRRPQSNDVASLLLRFPSIRVVGLNGAWAHNYLLRTMCKEQPYLRRRIDEGSLRIALLTSSSPACAMRNAVEVKTQRWKDALQWTPAAAATCTTRC